MSKKKLPMEFRCPSCGEEMETTNKFPKCFHCRTSLKVVKTNPRIVVVIRHPNKEG